MSAGTGCVPAMGTKLVVGTSVCKWTVSYFALAVVWLLLAEVLMVAGLGFGQTEIGWKETLVTDHKL